jgi:hypothetical protein
MKLFFGVLVSIAVVLAFGSYLIHRSGGSPASTTMSTSVPQPVPSAEAPVLHASSDEGVEVPIVLTSSDEEAGASSAGIGSDRPAEKQHEEIAALREEMALLRAEVSALQRWRRVQQRAATVVAPGKADDPAKDPRTDPAAHAAAERERQKQMEVVETNFRQEAADPRWSFEAEGAVQAALASDEVVQNTLLGLECRSQTCRLELADDDMGELAKVMPLFLHQLGQTLPSATANYVDDGHGGKIMILYMSREANAPLRPSR